MTVKFDLRPALVKLNQQANYFGQRSLSSKVTVRAPGHTDTRRNYSSTWTIEVVARSVVQFRFRSDAFHLS